MNELRKSFLVSLWFMFLTFPIMVIRVNTVENTVLWRWENMALIGIGSFVLSFVWRWAMRRKETSDAVAASGEKKTGRLAELAANPNLTNSCERCFWSDSWSPLAGDYLPDQHPHFFSAVCCSRAWTQRHRRRGRDALLGHAAFYAIGAYSYALLNQYFGLGFWFALPLGGVFAALAGIALAFPVLRLRGDYLAIVTLGFGEIVRLLLENWSDITGGPSGISNIPRPGFFDMKLSVADANIYIYYIVLALAIVTIIAVTRLKDSRIGRALQALREDEVACEAMGIDRVGVKVMAFGLGTAWAGFAGVIFAAKTTFINPASFTFFESAIILSIVVLGGMGSNLGVILGSAFLVLLPEYLRAFSEYRMIMFATAMVLMMVFRPQGLIPAKGRTYTVDDPDLEIADGGRK